VFVLSDRYRETSLTRSRRVLAAWLAALPTGGWERTVGDLEAELVRIARRDSLPTFVPRRNRLGRRIAAELRFVQASRFRVEFRRINRQRALRFARS
jgi:hypothetical protein